MIDPRTIERFAVDPAAFREALIIPAADGPARFTDVMADFQRRDFEEIDKALLALKAGTKPAKGRLWIERTKGASKDTDLAVCLMWLLAFTPRPLTCQVGAADQDQADELRKQAKLILRMNPWLGDVLQVQAWSIQNVRTDSRAEIIATDVGGSHGARPDLLILNELSHVVKEEFARNLLDNASKVPNGVVIIATNAGFQDSWAWTVREMARTSFRWHFSAYKRPAPWVDPAELEDARRRNSPARFSRLWEGEWSRGVGDALDENDVLASVREDLSPMDGDERGYIFFGGLDLGIKRDHAALCIVGKHVGHTEETTEPEPDRPALPSTIAACVELGILEDPRPQREPTYASYPATGRLRLAYCQSWAPRPGKPVDLELVESTVRAIHQRFRPIAICFDPFQAALMAQRLTRRGVRMDEVAFVGKNLDAMASGLLEEFTARNIDLYPDPPLLADLRRLRIAEKSYGHKLEATRDETGHADRATALTLALFGARKYPFAAPAVVEGPLVCWPD